MGQNNKKYLDYAGLEKLVDMHAVVPHPEVAITEEGAYKIAFDEHGHITSKSALTAADLGLDNALHFVGVSTTDPLSTTGATVAGHTGAFGAGDVVLYKRTQAAGDNGQGDHYDDDSTSGTTELYYEEYIYTGTAWELLGDASSYALKEVKITSDGTYITGGGDLSADRKFSHKTYTAAAAAIKAIGRDSGGHVVIGNEITVQSGGGSTHDHTTSTTIAANTYVTGVTDTHTKLSVTPTTAKVLNGLEEKLANLDTTSITGVSGSTTASKATAQTAVSVAKAGTAVRYGTANVGTEVTGLAKRASSKTTVGNANVATSATIIGNADVGAATVYGTANVGDAITVQDGKADVGTATRYGTANVGEVVSVAQQATAQTKVGNADVGAATVYGTADAGTPVTFTVGKADVGTENTVATRASAQTTIGNANVASAATTVGNADVGTATRYGTANVGDTITIDAGKADVGSAVVYGKANVGEVVTVAQQATAQSTFLTGVSAAAPTTTITTSKDVYHAEVSGDTLVLSAVTLSATTTAPTLTPTTGNIYGVSGSIDITPAVAAPNTQTLTPAKASNRTVSFTPAAEAPDTQTLTPAAASSTSIYGAVASENKIWGVGGTVKVTSAKAATGTQTITPAVTSTKTLTPAKAVSDSSTKIYGVSGSVDITPAVEAPTSQTMTPAKASNRTKSIAPAVAAPSTQTLTPAKAATATIYGAVASNTEIYGVTADQVSIKPAVEAPDTQKVTPAVANGTITPYTFTNVTVPTAASAITVATGSVSVGGAGGAIMTGVEATELDVMTDATIVAGTTGDVEVVNEVTATKNTAKTFTGTTDEHTCPAHTHTLTTA